MKIIKNYEIRVDILCAYEAHHHSSYGRSLFDLFEFDKTISRRGKSIEDRKKKMYKILKKEKNSSRRRLYEFLSKEKGSRSTVLLYHDFIKRNNYPAIPEWDENWLLENEKSSMTGSDYRAMKEHILGSLDIVDDGTKLNEYYFIDEHTTMTACKGLVINQEVFISPKDHYEDFRYFFSFLLRKVSSAQNFLIYQLERSFDGDLNNYHSFLLECIQKEDLNVADQKVIEKWMSINIQCDDEKPRVNRKNVMNEPILIRCSPIEANRKKLIELVNCFITKKSSKRAMFAVLEAAANFGLVVCGYEESEYDELFSLLTNRKISRIKKEPFEITVYNTVKKYLGDTLKRTDLGHVSDKN
ncbi:MAG: hypothetical protein JXR10_04560 [Cyclobacteriaceae bacterium]